MKRLLFILLLLSACQTSEARKVAEFVSIDASAKMTMELKTKVRCTATDVKLINPPDVWIGVLDCENNLGGVISDITITRIGPSDYLWMADLETSVSYVK